MKDEKILLDNTDRLEKEDFNENIVQKNKKGIYLASSVLCTLTVGAITSAVMSQKDAESDDNVDVAPKVKEDEKLKNSGKRDDLKSLKETEIKPLNEDEMEDAIEIAKAVSIESQENTAPAENLENSKTEEKSNDDLEYYSYNLEEQMGTSSDNVVNPPASTGQAMTSNSVVNAMRYWNYFEYYGYTYGVDPYLLVAMASQESRGDHDSTIPGGKYYKGHGFGIMQIEKPGIVTKKITAYNHVTKSYDIMNINSGNDVVDVGLNIKAGAMQLAQKAKEQQYNPFVTIQGYNYGTSGVKYALSYYIANGDINRVDEIYGSGRGEHLLYYIAINNTDWINTPTASGMTAREWYSSEGWKKFGAGRGDKLYIEHVMRYYRGNGRPYIIKDTGERVEF